jgi:hypothetical protein
MLFEGIHTGQTVSTVCVEAFVIGNLVRCRVIESNLTILGIS